VVQQQMREMQIQPEHNFYRDAPVQGP